MLLPSGAVRAVSGIILTVAQMTLRPTGGAAYVHTLVCMV